MHSNGTLLAAEMLDVMLDAYTCGYSLNSGFFEEIRKY